MHGQKHTHTHTHKQMKSELLQIVISLYETLAMKLGFSANYFEYLYWVKQFKRWCRNYLFFILGHLYIKVNNTGTKYVRIIKQTAF
jgi:putative Mn2+ efflux pump MntP